MSRLNPFEENTKKHEELVEEMYRYCIGNWGRSPRNCMRHLITLALSAFRDGRLGQFKEALEKTEHELTTLHGLIVCDGFKAYHEAQRAGADAEGAWNSFVEETWQIDTGEALGVIKAALHKEGK